MDDVCGRGRGTNGNGCNPVVGGGSGRGSRNDGGGGRRSSTDGGGGKGSGTDGGAAAEDLGIIDDGNIENVWNHGLRVVAGFKCRYCYWMKKGGGATQLREHLGGILGNVVLLDIRDAMRRVVRKGKQKRKDAKERKLRIEDQVMQRVDQRAPIDVDDDDEMQMALAAKMRDLHFRQGLQGRSGIIEHGSGSGSGSGSGAASCTGNSGRIGMMSRNAGATGRVYDADVSRSRTSMQACVDTMFNKNANEDIGRA